MESSFSTPMTKRFPNLAYLELASPISTRLSTGQRENKRGIQVVFVDSLARKAD